MDNRADNEPRPGFLPRLDRGQLIMLDTGMAMAYTLLLLPAAVLADPGTPFELPLWLRFLIAAGAALPVALRRLWPRTIFTVVLAVSLLMVWLGLGNEAFIGPAFALYLVAVTAPRRAWEPTAAIAVMSGVGAVALTAIGTIDMQAQPIGAALLGLMLMGGAWTVGRAVQDRRQYAARAAEQRAEQAVTDERLRIARELHDIVAHSMSLIAVKAGIANHVMAVRPAEAHDALRVIETTSRDALIEMRHLLGVLRSEQLQAGTADLGPAPGLAGLPDLVDRAAMAGVQVTLDVAGGIDLPEGIELAVFRIVQEAVTNVVKHAAPARCLVTVTADHGDVHIEVTNDWRGSRVTGARHGLHRPASHGGHGLVGMRERVAMYDGRFSAGPLPEGGYRVSAHLPYDSSRKRTDVVSGGVVP